MGSTTLFNSVFINPEQVARFQLCIANSRTAQHYNVPDLILGKFTGCDQPVQRSYWPENAIALLAGLDNVNDMPNARVGTHPH